MNITNLSRHFMARLGKAQQQTLRLPSFSHFPLHESIFKFLQQREIIAPSYIQYALLTKLHGKSLEGHANSPHHIISPTGSGKTLAYMIPIVDSLKKQQMAAQQALTTSKRPRALILTSNKQLVLQGKNVAKDVCHFAKLKCDGIGIGRTLGEQRTKISEGVDIVVSGYTRFKRMLDQREVFISNLNWIVVDEMDTLFQSQKSLVSQMFQTIITPKLQGENPPKLIFSSTTNPPSLKQYLFKKVPKLQQIIDKNVHVNLQNIKHEFLHCPTLDKHQPLLDELRRDKKLKIIVFCNTVKSLHELQFFLNEQGIPVTTLHSQLSKQSRIGNYQYFRDSQKGIMLSTDLGARGLHFPKLQKVINYDFPISTCDYLQRAGRTGRAGEKGTVVSMYFKKDLPIINQLRDASFSTPLKIKNSAYGFKNREETKRPNKFTKFNR